MKDKSLLTLDRLFKTKEFKSKSFGAARWLDDDTGYATLEASADEKNVKELVHYDMLTGERSLLVTAVDLQPPHADKPLIIKNYAWSEDKKRLLIFTNSKRVWRVHSRGDYWVLDMETRQLTQIGQDAEPASLMFAKFSPDGESVAYVYKNNIYVETLAHHQLTKLTKDGDETIINGTSDWVYEEEFKLRDGFRWSQDGKYIAYWQFDTTGIEPFYIINNTDSLYPKLMPLPYPKVGTTNSACRVGVVAVKDGPAYATTWFDVPGDPRNHYIPKMEWAANSEQVVIQQLNRLQNKNRVMLGDVSNGATHTILVDEDKAWVEVGDDLKWLDDGNAFTWLSERDGWRHLYRISRDGQEVTLLTPGDFDVIAVLNIAEDTGWVYFSAAPDNPSQRYLYRVDLAGNGRMQRKRSQPRRYTRLSPLDQPGTHNYNLSPTAKWAFHTYSNFDTPPITSLISLPDHKPLRILEDNQALHEKVSALKRQPTEFFRTSITDAQTQEEIFMDGWLIKPPDFDSAQKYPLLFYVYGEPAGQTVLDRWQERTLWHQMLAQQGYLVMSIDNRGTPAPRGRNWRKCVYRQVGILSTADQAAAAQAIIKSRPYIDADRVGVWGWSGGGSMTLNLMFQHSDIYCTGIAIAAVSNQRYYDTVYQERYMGLPEDNEEGFTNGSPITYADQLKGNLLLIHGTGDDNVHYQCFETVVNELIKHNKQFSMMAYPNRSHAIKEGDNTSRHLFSLMTNYLQANL